MLLHRKIRELSAGGQLKVLATDPSTQRDIAKFCTFLEHELLLSEQQGDEFHFLIRKKA